MFCSCRARLSASAAAAKAIQKKEYQRALNAWNDIRMKISQVNEQCVFMTLWIITAPGDEADGVMLTDSILVLCHVLLLGRR